MAAAAAIVVLLLWLAVAGAQGPAPCDTASVHQGASGTWTVYTALTFDTGPTHIVSLATDPAGNEPWYATNGQEIAASADHGCGWRIVYKLPATPSADMPLSSGTSAIKSVSTGGGTVLAAVSGPARVVDLGDTNLKGQKPSANGATVVLRSTDSGASFTATQTLPNTSGDTGPIVQAPSSPNTVYLATGLAMRQSTDGGKTFSDPDVLVEGNADTTALGGVAEIAVDPGDADNVLARGPWQVHHATNGRNYPPYPGNTENHPYGLTLHGPAFGGGSGSRGRALFVQGDEPNKKDQVDRYLVSEDGAQNFATHLPGEWEALSGSPTAAV